MKNIRRRTAMALGVIALPMATGCATEGDAIAEQESTPTSEVVSDYLTDLTSRCEAQTKPDVPNADPCLEIAEYNGARLSGVLFNYYVENLSYPESADAAVAQMSSATGASLSDGVSLTEYTLTEGEIIKNGVRLCVVHEASGAWASYSDGGTTADARGVSGADCQA